MTEPEPYSRRRELGISATYTGVALATMLGFSALNGINGCTGRPASLDEENPIKYIISSGLAAIVLFGGIHYIRGLNRKTE